jgi:Spy/CpxP family protein refolding chaperone
MNQLKTKIGILTLTLFLVTIVNAQSPCCANFDKTERAEWQKGEMRMECHADRMKDMLDLTEEQQTQIKNLRTNQQKAMLPLKNELGEKKARMKTLQTAEKADMKAITTLIDEMGAIKIKMAKVKAANHQEIRSVLNEEQRLKFDLHISNSKKHFKYKRP